MGIFDKLFGVNKKSQAEASNMNSDLGTNFVPTVDLMEEHRFWKIIETTHRNTNGNFELQQNELANALNSYLFKI